MQEFLNPKSMLTPGGAGALLMFLVNGIACQFPEIEPRFMALLLSFLISGILIISAKALADSKLIEKSLYWLLNAFIVFVIGFGSANIANEVNGPNEPIDISSFFLTFIPEAYAQGQPPQAGRSEDHRGQTTRRTDRNNGKEAEKMHAMQEENERLKNELQTMRKRQPPAASRSNQGFFRKW